MEIKVGDYVRTNLGISKIIGQTLKIGNDIFYVVDKNGHHMVNSFDDYINEVEIIKSSSNVIDLIKKRDILISKDGNLYQCSKICNNYVFTTSKTKYGQIITLVDYQIDKVITLEEFESIGYKL